MIKKIRRCAFETNSSSSHTLVLDMECELVQNPFDTIEEEIVIQALALGWDWTDYFKPIDKIRCAFTAACQYKDSKDTYIDMIYDVVFDYTNVKCIFEPTEDYYPYGYIDHQSYGEIDSIFKSIDAMRQFIFGKESVYHTGNDNGYDPRLKLPDGYDVHDYEGTGLKDVSEFIIKHDLYQKLTDFYINLETYESYPWVSLKYLSFDELLQINVDVRKMTPEAMQELGKLSINDVPELEIVFEM